MYRLLWVAFLFVASVSVSADENPILIDGPEVDLTQKDVKRALAALEPKARIAIITDKQRLRKVMDTTYMAKVAAERARKHGLDKDPGVQARIWNRTINILALAEVDHYIKERISSEGDLEALAKERYLLDKEKYRVPEKVRASHILLKTEGKDEKTVLKRIQDIRRDILSGKLSFDEAAKKYSEGPSASRGGHLGIFARGRMVKPFEDVAFSLEPGVVSEPVKTRFGYHLILVEEKLPARQHTFEEVKEKIIKEVKKEIRKKLATDFWLEIRDDPRIKLNQKAIDAFIQTPDWHLGARELQSKSY